MGPPPGASLPMRMMHHGQDLQRPAEYKVAARCAPERLTPLGSSLTAARSAIACHRARAHQGQAFGGAEEAPSLTATARHAAGRGGRKPAARSNKRIGPRKEKWSVLCNRRLTSRAPYKACSGFTHVTARRIAQPPKVTFVARLRPGQLPDQAARRLPDLSTIIRVRSSLTDGSRLRGARSMDEIATAIAR